MYGTPTPALDTVVGLTLVVSVASAWLVLVARARHVVARLEAALARG